MDNQVNNISDILAERFYSLPAYVQDLLISPDFVNKVSEISRKQVGDELIQKNVRDQIYLLLLFFTPYNLFIPALITELNISYDQAESILDDLKNMLPVEYIDQLKNISTDLEVNAPSNTTVVDTPAEIDAIESPVQPQSEPEPTFPLTTETEGGQLTTQITQSETPEREKQIVEPLRTLEGDMKKVHGYGAYVGQQEQSSEVTHKSEQSDTLKKPPLADRPSYTN